MILYTLHCADGHEFESWFRDSGAYDLQVEQGLVACPHCHSLHISKSVMAPSIRRSKRAETEKMAAETSREVAFLDERHASLRAMIRDLREKIFASTDDVGEKFAAEARRMHDGEKQSRAIRGRASLEEARALLEEGIEILPIPGSNKGD